MEKRDYLDPQTPPPWGSRPIPRQREISNKCLFSWCSNQILFLLGGCRFQFSCRYWIDIGFVEHSFVLLSWNCRCTCCSVMPNGCVRFSNLIFTIFVLQSGECNIFPVCKKKSRFSIFSKKYPFCCRKIYVHCTNHYPTGECTVSLNCKNHATEINLVFCVKISLFY